jgi:hypothetical protein
MSAPAVTWRTRVVRRVSFAVFVASVVPALANAAGASVPNPVAIALRASGRSLQHALSSESTESLAPCGTPSATASTEPSVEPTVEPTAVATESVEPTESVAPSETAAPSESPSVEPTEDCATPSASATPTVTESESPEPSESPEAENEDGGAHGKIVSTVAQCAPHGQDPLLSVEGAPSNHGGYISAAAKGESLTTPWGAFDLSTQAGADSLCAALAKAEAAQPAAPSHGKSKASHGKGKGHGKGHKPESSDDSSDGSSEPGSD